MRKKIAVPLWGFEPLHHQRIIGSRLSGNVDGNINDAGHQIADPTMSDPCFCGGCDECAEALLQWELWGDEQIESDEDIMRDAVERTLDVPFELHQIEQADEACFKNMTRLGL